MKPILFQKKYHYQHICQITSKNVRTAQRLSVTFVGISKYLLHDSVINNTIEVNFSGPDINGVKLKGASYTPINILLLARSLYIGTGV